MPLQRGRSPWPWIAVAAVIVVLVAALGYVVGRSAPPAQQAGPAPFDPNRGTTDLSSMSPREQADRLFDRVMISHEQGQADQVSFFAPMAIQAYAVLGAMDADARYHVGLINAISGRADAALAQADSLELSIPGHLMAAMLRNGVAQARADEAAVASSYRKFLDHYEAEMAARRPEYEAHSTAMQNFHSEAQQAVRTQGS